MNKVEIEKMIKYNSIPSVPAKIRRKTNSSYMPVIEFKLSADRTLWEHGLRWNILLPSDSVGPFFALSPGPWA